MVLENSEGSGLQPQLGPDTVLRNCHVADGAIIGRGNWENQRFAAGSHTSDRLAEPHRHFRKRHCDIPVEPKLCFGILPFRGSYPQLFENVIWPALRELGYECQTGDQSTLGVISDHIWESINRAAIVVAEVSEDNPNVWYEVGLANAMNKPVIMFRRKDLPAPFDIAHLRILYYTPEAGDARPLLQDWMRTFKLASEVQWNGYGNCP